MKRSEVLEKMAAIMEDKFDGDSGYWYDDANAVLTYLEEIGMCPPLTPCTLVPDTSRGGMKHSEVKREWEPE